MSLKDHLSAIKSKSNPPPEVAAVMQRTKNDLAASGLAEKVPKAGDQAPGIILPNIYGDTVDSGKILEKGPLVLHFYRGGW